MPLSAAGARVNKRSCFTVTCMPATFFSTVTTGWQ
jgi:hypothetical protein